MAHFDLGHDHALGGRTAPTGAWALRILSAMVASFRRQPHDPRQAVPVAAATPVEAKPRRYRGEREYLADIGMEVGF
jgi:hypothetical protein